MKGNEFFSKIAGQTPFSKMHPKIATFFKEYLAHEKVVQFQDRFVVNTHFPPYPSRAFDKLAENFDNLGKTRKRSLFSVTLAVTNRCPYDCWHCYNAGRCQRDLPLKILQEVSRDLQNMGTIHVTLTGGEPLVRHDLEGIAASFEKDTYLSLNTTGAGLTCERASALQEAGIFAVGVSLDSPDPQQHDRMRGKEGAFRTAVEALRFTSEAGLYAYIVTVASKTLLQRQNFKDFVKFASDIGAREIHLLEPCATGKLAGNKEVLLDAPDQRRILEYQQELAETEELPVLSSFLYLESSEAFGCGAGLTHLYIDGSGEVCPCNLMPLSFGNVTQESLHTILERLGNYFCQPRCDCLGKVFSPHINGQPLPLSPQESIHLCEQHLPKQHPLPRFFQVQAEATDAVGQPELREAYNEIHSDYDTYWLSEAGKPIQHLIANIPLKQVSSVMEAGCGTGYATALLARTLSAASTITAIDLSEGMLTQAKRRLQRQGAENIRFVAGDALEFLGNASPVDLVLSTWVLGYIPLKAFFNKTSRALRQHGLLAFVVHKENSPREPLEIFSHLVAADPSALQKRVQFDFPVGVDQVKQELTPVGFHIEQIWEGSITFTCVTPEAALEHLLKSGAGTAYFNAIDPAKRQKLSEQFLTSFAARKQALGKFDVVHDYVACIARKQ